MSIWKFFHIVSMFAAVSLFVGTSVLFERLVATRDVPAIRRFEGVAGPVVRAAIAIVLLGLVFGLITVNDEGFSYTQGWVVAAYVLFFALFALGPFEGRWQVRIFTAARESPDDAPSPRLEALITSTARRAIVWSSMVLYVLIIYDMVRKPFS
jgi:hypothetical protein